MRRAIVLDKTGEDAETRVFRVVFWYPVPEGRESFYANPDGESALSGEGELAPTKEELAALRAGTVHEDVVNMPLAKQDGKGNPLSTDAFLASAATTIEAFYQARLTEIESYNPWLLYGTQYSDEAGGWELRTVADVETGRLDPARPMPVETATVDAAPFEQAG
jgi:hypothetical protein